MAFQEEPPGEKVHQYRLYAREADPVVDPVNAYGVSSRRQSRPLSRVGAQLNVSRATTAVGSGAGPSRLTSSATVGNGLRRSSAIRRSSRQLSSFGIQANADTEADVQDWVTADKITGVKYTENGPIMLPRAPTEDELRKAEFERVEQAWREEHFERFLDADKLIYPREKHVRRRKCKKLLGRVFKPIVKPILKPLKKLMPNKEPKEKGPEPRMTRWPELELANDEEKGKAKVDNVAMAHAILIAHAKGKVKVKVKADKNIGGAQAVMGAQALIIAHAVVAGSLPQDTSSA